MLSWPATRFLTNLAVAPLNSLYNQNVATSQDKNGYGYVVVFNFDIYFILNLKPNQVFVEVTLHS